MRAFSRIAWVCAPGLALCGAALGQQPSCAPIFAFRAGDTPASPSSVLCTLNASTTPLVYTLTPSATWIVVSPRSGTVQPNGTTSIAVSVNPAGLTPNTYTGTLTTNAQGYTIPAISVTLTVTSSSSTQPIVTTAVNAGSYDRNASLAPGVIFSVFGLSLSDGTTVSAPATPPLPTRLAGTTLLVNGTAAPLYYVSPTQINAEFPVELANVANVSIQVQVQVGASLATSTSVSVGVSAYSPSILTLDANGVGSGAIQHAKDFSLVCPVNRIACSPSFASQGEIIAIYALGLGPVQGPWVSGIPVPSAAQTVTTPVVKIGGVQAQVVFAGLVTQFVGLYQVNVVVPVGVPLGNNVPVNLTIGGVVSNQASISIGTDIITPEAFRRGGGPPGGTFPAIKVDQSNPSTIYAVENSGRIFRSVNGGQAWSGPIFRANVLSGAAAFSVDPNNSSVLYVGVAGGLYKSADAGQTWTSLSDNVSALPDKTSFGGSGALVTAIAVDPRTPGTMFAGTWGPGIFKSTDGGKTWSPVNVGFPSTITTGGFSGLPVSTLVFDPTNSSVVYAGFFDGGGVYKTVDGGRNWTAQNSGLSTNALSVFSIAIDPGTPQTIYVGTLGPGAYKSTTGGQSWTALQPLGQSGYSAFVALDPKTSTTVYVVGAFGLSKSTNGGQNFSILPPPGEFGTNFYSLAIDPANTTILYAGTYSAGIFKSADGGQTWTTINSGLGSSNVNAIAVSSSRAVYAGSYGGGVYKSTDTGQSWNFLPSQSWNVQNLAVDPKNPSIIYAGVQGGLLKSVDGGATWKTTGAGLGGENVALVTIDPTNSNTLYGAVGGSGVNRIFKSIDGGQSFTTLAYFALPSGQGQVYSIVVDPSNPAIVYAGIGYFATFSNARLGVFKSIDGGQTWSLSSNGIPGEQPEVSSLAIDYSNPSTVYAGIVGLGVFRSTDRGQSWTLLLGSATYNDKAALINDVQIAIDPVTPTILYAVSGFSISGGGGVFRSSDGGKTWNRINTGLPDSGVNHLNRANLGTLTIDPVITSTIYVGTQVGVFKTTNSGQTWQPTGAN